MGPWCDPRGTDKTRRRQGNAHPTGEDPTRGLAGVGETVYRVRQTPLQRTREAGVCKSPQAQHAACRTARRRSDPNHQPRTGGSRYTFNAGHVSGAEAVAASGFLQKPPQPRLARTGVRIPSPPRPAGSPPDDIIPAPFYRTRLLLL